MPKKTMKKNVHLIPHTHWDREWYFTSDDSRSMTYWDIKFLLERLETHPNEKFLYDGQTSVVDDFLTYAPELKTQMAKLIKNKQLMVGPWYTQTDNLQPLGESIIRNLEIGGKIAEDMGHRMNVGYLPDSFGHNPQTPQIMRMVGIDNFSFYRGIDPKKINNQLFFNYQAPSGDTVLGVWQTHYTTSKKILDFAGFKKFARYEQKNHPIDVSVESYARRSNGLPIWIPIGTDMRPYDPIIVDTKNKMNQVDEQYNYLISSYEDLIEDAKQEIKNNNIKLPLYIGELREALTGRAHRSIISARQDLKQLINKVENILVNEVEPLAYMCEKMAIDVPYRMITKCWKDVFKSSAHDSYGGSVEDVVYEKIISRLNDAFRVSSALSAMLSQIYASKYKLLDRSKKDLFILNPKSQKYSGLYEIEFIVGPAHNTSHKLTILDQKELVPYTIVDRDPNGTHERDMLTVILFIKDVPAFGHKKLDVIFDQPSREIINSATKNVETDYFKLDVVDGILNITNKKTGRTINNFVDIVADPSNGDTYDHSPITWNDKLYWFKNFKITEVQKIGQLRTIILETQKELPNGLAEWTNNKTSINQRAQLFILLYQDRLLLKLKITNVSKNARLRLMFNTTKITDSWEHDMQFSVSQRQVENEYLATWEKVDKYNAKWEEYPTNLSPHQSWIRVSKNKYAVTTYNSKEHEVVNLNKNAYIALTLYRAVAVFGKGHFIYRPGRSSGAKCIAPKAQLLEKQLTFKAEIFFEDKSNFELFKAAEQYHKKPFLLDGSWGKERVILRWETNHRWYDKNPQIKKMINNTPKIPHGLIVTAIYKTSHNQNVMRIFNPSDKAIKIDLSKFKYGFNLSQLNNSGPLLLTPWKLVTVKI